MCQMADKCSAAWRTPWLPTLLLLKTQLIWSLSLRWFKGLGFGDSRVRIGAFGSRDIDILYRGLWMKARDSGPRPENK